MPRGIPKVPRVRGQTKLVAHLDDANFFRSDRPSPQTQAQDDRRYAELASEPPPVWSDWMRDKSKLPKVPPGRRK